MSAGAKSSEMFRPPKREPRCYHEYCGAVATHDLTDYGQGKSGPFNLDHPVYEWRGVWGWCDQHHPDDGLCATCRVPEHDACPLTAGCSCCEDTRARMTEYPPCPTCGDPIDYCQGHGVLG